MSEYGDKMDREKLLRLAARKRSKGKSPPGRPEAKGRSWGSGGERDCYLDHLKALEFEGEISELELQVSVRLQGIRFVMDFKFFDKALGEYVWADFKGFEGQRWGVCKKLWSTDGPGRLRVYKANASGFYVAQEIIPNRRQL